MNPYPSLFAVWLWRSPFVSLCLRTVPSDCQCSLSSYRSYGVCVVHRFIHANFVSWLHASQMSISGSFLLECLFHNAKLFVTYTVLADWFKWEKEYLQPSLVLWRMQYLCYILLEMHLLEMSSQHHEKTSECRLQSPEKLRYWYCRSYFWGNTVAKSSCLESSFWGF